MNTLICCKVIISNVISDDVVFLSTVRCRSVLVNARSWLCKSNRIALRKSSFFFFCCFLVSWKFGSSLGWIKSGWKVTYYSLGVSFNYSLLVLLVIHISSCWLLIIHNSWFSKPKYSLFSPLIIHYSAFATETKPSAQYVTIGCVEPNLELRLFLESKQSLPCKAFLSVCLPIHHLKMSL